MAAYLIADLEITNTPAFEEYRKRVPAVIAAHGGRYLARGGATAVLEGSVTLHRTVIVEFESMAALRAFYDSPEYRPLRELRAESTRSTLIAIEGV
jgi:uncharacterized protein (DUF1330 family)